MKPNKLRLHQKLLRFIAALLQLQFVKFVIIGCINTFTGTIISYCLTFALQANIAFIMGYLTSLMIAYLLNSIFVFKEKIGAKRYLKFCISYIPNFIIQNSVVLLFHNILQWHKLIAFALAAVIGIPVTYLCVKLFAFGKGNKK